MLAGQSYDSALVPWNEYRYAAYAYRFGWTPAQVDDMPIMVEDWLFPIVSAIDDQINRDNERKQADAERRQRKFGRRR